MFYYTLKSRGESRIQKSEVRSQEAGVRRQESGGRRGGEGERGRGKRFGVLVPSYFIIHNS